MTTPAELERLAVESGRLIPRYSEAQRRYHDLSHVQRVLEVVETLHVLAADLPAVRLAAWFHDSVYEPGRDDNERRSADLAAETLLRVGADHALVQEVARLVLLTEEHRVAPDDRNGMVLSDADLAILGAPTEEYDRFAAAVREEYAHVPPDEFVRGRIAVLRSLADRDHIYATHWGRDHLEPAARSNLAREIAELATAAP